MLEDKNTSKTKQKSMEENEKNSSVDSSIFDRLLKILAVIAGCIIVIMTVMICASVIMRYFFRMPLGWSIEISEYMLFFIAFLGAAWLLKNDGHVKIDLLTNNLPLLPQIFFKIWTSFLSAFICLVITYYGTISTIDHFHRGIPVIQALAIPKYLLLWVIPVGTLLLLIQSIRDISSNINEFRALFKKQEH